MTYRGRWNLFLLVLPAVLAGVVGSGCQSRREAYYPGPDGGPAYMPGPGGGSAYSQPFPTSPGYMPAPAATGGHPGGTGPNPAATTTGGLVLTQYAVPVEGGPPQAMPHGGAGAEMVAIGPPGGLPVVMGGPGPHGPMPPGPLPTELAMVSHPPYRVAPPDILLIQSQQLLPRPPYQIQPLEVLTIQVADALPNQPILGKYTVAPDGNVNLGFAYGSVRVGGLTVEQAQESIRRHLGRVLRNPQVVVGLEQYRTVQQVIGEHLVRPDGTISLGEYGCVYVAGLCLDQVKAAVEKQLSCKLLDPKVSVDVFAYNSKKYYVIADGGGYGQYVKAFPYTGNETVLDAIEKIGGLPAVSSNKKIWVARPAPACHGCTQILPVDWQAIVQGGSTPTNYQLFPGDRVYIRADPFITADNYLAKVLRPVERIFGITLLGTTTVNSFRNGGNTGFVPIVGF